MKSYFILEKIGRGIVFGVTATARSFDRLVKIVLVLALVLVSNVDLNYSYGANFETLISLVGRILSR